ncbi:MAG: hypothetical protein J3K34DRAFT_418634 [Monoraphidium minutum]|nr:MAG: hypothetical protein J3K34DRAFT_418634 [Monoraphidium minutum]
MDNEEWRAQRTNMRWPGPLWEQGRGVGDGEHCGVRSAKMVVPPTTHTQKGQQPRARSVQGERQARSPDAVRGRSAPSAIIGHRAARTRRGPPAFRPSQRWLPKVKSRMLGCWMKSSPGTGRLPGSAPRGQPSTRLRGRAAAHASGRRRCRRGCCPTTAGAAAPRA